MYRADTMASAVLADPTRALQGTNRGSGRPWKSLKMTECGKWRLDLRFASARCLEIVCGTIATLYVLLVSLNKSLWGPQGAYRTILRSPPPRGLPGRSRPGFPRVGTFPCPLLPTISNGTLRMIHLASNTARRPSACGFHPDDHASQTQA
ncbi:hypothetical protein TNCV_1775501 [Trichonephila clavipes]|nr:hypothetical protein TNCV_1775501 [Trichonephila clavipes]